jgi:hypothetical protein
MNGQIRVDDSDVDGRLGVEEHERRVDDPERREALVEEPLGLEDADPGVDADEEARPERHDDDSDEDRTPAYRSSGHRVRHGESDEQQQKGRDGGDANRRGGGADVQVVAEQRLEGFEIEAFDEAADLLPSATREQRPVRRHRRRRVRQADLHDDDERDEEEDDEPQERQRRNGRSGEARRQASPRASPPACVMAPAPPRPRA